MKTYAVTKDTDLYKRYGGKFELLYEIPEDFQYKIFNKLEDARCIYNIINLKIQRTRDYIYAENKRLIEFESQYSIEEALEEGLYKVINEEYSNIFEDDEISKHIPSIY